MKTLGRIALVIVLIGIGLIIGGLIAGGTDAFRGLTAEDYTLVDLSYDRGAIEDIVLDFANKRIIVAPAEDDRIRIVYYVTERDPVTVTETDTSLSFVEDDDWVFSWFNNISWFVPNEYFACTLYLPSGADFDLDLTTSNGSLEIGDVDNIGAVEGYTSNGAVSLLASSFSGTVSIITSNGRMLVDDVVAATVVTLRSSNGRIDVTTLEAGGKVTLKSSNGAVDITGLTCPGLEVDTSNGDIDVVMAGNADDWRIVLETSNGDMFVDGVRENDGTLNPAALAVVDLDTSNGDIHLDFLG